MCKNIFLKKCREPKLSLGQDAVKVDSENFCFTFELSYLFTQHAPLRLSIMKVEKSVNNTSNYLYRKIIFIKGNNIYQVLINIFTSPLLRITRSWWRMAGPAPGSPSPAPPAQPTPRPRPRDSA